MKVVLDTNVWVSYFMAKKMAYLTALVYDHELQIYTDSSLVAELRDVLSRPKIKKYLKTNVGELVAFHQKLCYAHRTIPKYKDSPDPKDNFLYDLAAQSGARYVVTGDKKIRATNPTRFEFISKARFEALLK